MRARYRVSAAGVALGFLSAVSACKSEAPEIKLSRITIDAPATFDNGQTARAEIRAAIRMRLAADPTVAGFVRRPKATHRLDLRIFPIEEEPAGEEAYRPITVALRSLGQAPDYDVSGKAPAGDDLTASVLRGFDEAWPLLTKLRHLDVQKDRELIAALTDPDVRVRLFAVDRLGARRSEAAVGPLCALLNADERPEVVLRAIGSLVAIGDQTAVEPIIDLSYRQEPAFVLQIVFAVSAIGGRTAEGFLVTLASGHPHPEIQLGAKDALAELKRKRESARGAEDRP